MLKKIISGGQTGADQGGLEAGRELGLLTGGTAPHGWITEEGPMPKLLQSFGLTEGPFDPRTFPKRTELNVRNCDGVAIFGDLDSPGTRLTLRYCNKWTVPFICNPTPEELASWLEGGIETLNVAGNRESRHPGIQQRVRELIITAVEHQRELHSY